MSRQIEQALLSLMPTQSTELPPTLVELAGSLLAQSRHRASTLKADEEVARLYACAHLACERLKISLNLPPIAPRPPIPPRIYKRLYTYLESILPSSSATDRSNAGRLRTPNSKARDLGSSPFSQQRPVPSRGTPTKEQSLAQFRTRARGESQTPTKTVERSPGRQSKKTLPPWVKPVGRFFCAETGNQRLASTVLAGMESILFPSNRATMDDWALQNMTALFAAIYFYVTMRVKAMASGQEMDRSTYVPERKAILALLKQARQDVSITAETEEDAWTGWESIKPGDFDAAVARVNEQDWLQQDWFEAIDDIVLMTGNEDVDMLDAGPTDSGSNVQIRRADTMFQDKYDYLSEKRQAEYGVWKENVLAKIDGLLAQDGTMGAEAI
ncbi:Origin recognition complex subunit 6 [Paramyrothecium foliicola]|nr:Origin recognition complex subunit 6 [Paramyrothecium foliicola]